MKNIALFGILIGALAGSSFAQEVASDEEPQSHPDKQLEVHPYFKQVEHYELPQEGETRVIIDGYVLPKEIHLSCERMGWIEEARPLEFVLVLPQQFELDGFSFEVARPYYMARTELSNAQFAELGAISGGWASYEAYASIVNIHARIDLEYDAALLQLIEKYIAQPDHPAVTMDLSDAIFKAFRLSGLNNVHVRLPTMSEWYAAMRAGAATRYWWGDECDFDRIAWSDEPLRLLSTSKDVRSVYEGPENPLGIRNMIGNAAEIVFPTEKERQQLSVLEPKSHPADTYAVHSQAGLVLGGSVATTCGYEQDFDRLITRWEELWRRNWIVQNGYWLYQHWCSTARYVIESPPGEFVIEN